MSKSGKNKAKDNYFKLTFLIPVLYSAITAVLMVIAVYLATDVNLARDKIELAKTMVTFATYSLALSPSALMICVYISRKHLKKYPDGSSIYKMRPMVLSLLVMGLQVLYMASLAL